jgi:cephalosporin-C deacetylase
MRFLSTLIAVASFALTAAAQPQTAPKAPIDALSVSTDRANATYARGDTVTFTIELKPGSGAAPESAEVDWTLSKDGVEPKRTGKAALKNGRAQVTGTLDEPGFLQLRADWKNGTTKVNALGAAAVEPLAIKPSMPAPADFDAFWAAKKKALAAVPMNARLTPVKSPRDNVETFDLQADSVGAPVSGYLGRPKDAKPKSLPAILLVHGAGVRSSGLSGAAGWAADGALALDINAHGLPNGRDTAFYDDLAKGEMKDYRVRGRESRETIYFLGMFLRLVRAIDFLAAQPEWDGRTVVVSGASQGGAQAIAAAGLDPRVTFFVAGVPAMCDHTGFAAGRINGWPKFIATNEKAPTNVIEAVRYYDGVIFAARAKVPGFFTVGFIDTTCPPSSVYAAYNALKTPKEIHFDVDAGHTNTPAANRAMKAAALAHFASQRASAKASQ